MSRHRIIRTMDYNDEYDGYDDIYGHSVDDECISPTDAQQWLFDRARGHQSMSAFMRDNKDIAEEEEDEDADKSYEKSRRDSDNFQMPTLSDMEKAQLTSCIDEVRSVVGDIVSEKRIVETSIKFDYDINKILDDILNDEYGNKSKRLQKDTPSKGGVLQSKVSLSELVDKKTVAPASPVVKVTALQTEAKRGFDISSPVLPSPAASGRNTPVDFSEDPNKKNVATVAATDFFKVSKEQSQRDAKQLYTKERADQKHNFHMIVIGHVDAGKSTLMGHLLFDTGNVSQRIMHKHEQESKKMGKQSFMYAWVLDETGEERARGRLKYSLLNNETSCLRFRKFVL